MRLPLFPVFHRLAVEGKTKPTSAASDTCTVTSVSSPATAAIDAASPESPTQEPSAGTSSALPATENAADVSTAGAEEAATAEEAGTLSPVEGSEAADEDDNEEEKEPLAASRAANGVLAVRTALGDFEPPVDDEEAGSRASAAAERAAGGGGVQGDHAAAEAEAAAAAAAVIADDGKPAVAADADAAPGGVQPVPATTPSPAQEEVSAIAFPDHSTNSTHQQGRGSGESGTLRQPSPTLPPPAAVASPPPPSPGPPSAASGLGNVGVREKRPTSPTTVSRPIGPGSPGDGNVSSHGGAARHGGAAVTHEAPAAGPPGYGVPAGGFAGYKFMNP